MHQIIDLVLSTKYLTAQEEPISCILHSTNGAGALYLGTLEAANNPELLKKHRIKAVLSALTHESLDIHPQITHLVLFAFILLYFLADLCY